MKKVMFAAAVAAGMLAFGEAIESENVVGFTTKSASAAGKYVLAAAQFEGTDGNAADIQSLFTTTYALQAYDLATGDLVSDTWYVGAAEIQIPTAAGSYAVYYYGYNVYDSVKDEVTTGWADREGNLVSLAIIPGTGIWLKGAALENAPYTSSGQVLDSGTVSSAKSTYQLVANPLPIEADINGSTFTWGGLTAVQAYNLETGDLVSDTWYTNAAEIQIPTAAGSYAVYYYGYNVYDSDKDEVTTGWADREGNLVKSATIPVATGIWLKQNGGFSFTAER